MGRFVTGVTVVTTRLGERVHGMTANAFLSVSIDPPLILVSVSQRARMHGYLLEAGRYGVSILSEDQEAVSDHFAGRVREGLDLQFEERGDIPLIAGALAQVVARVVEAHPVGDHTLFIGEVEHLFHREGRPLCYYAGRYGRLE